MAQVGVELEVDISTSRKEKTRWDEGSRAGEATMITASKQGHPDRSNTW